MNNELSRFTEWLYESDWPQPQCHMCNEGRLVRATISEFETAKSLASHNHDAWEPDMVSGFFHGTMKCKNEECSEVVVVSGDMKWDYLPDPGSWEYPGGGGSWHLLRFAIPAFEIARQSPNCPEVVMARIHDAAKIIWVDPSSSANRLRSAAEELLTARRIPKTTWSSKENKRVRLTTHARIEKLAKDNKPAADALLAVKWIGNVGSHTGSLSPHDVLEGAEYLSYALELIYDKYAYVMERRIQDVIRRRGVSRRRN